jgi:uncharacterized membrane protein
MSILSSVGYFERIGTKGTSLSKQRLEAFSDGVFAIVITLLILGIRIPEVQPAALGEALSRMLPQVFTYVLSFFVVGLYWFAHHRVSHQVKQINGSFIWLNFIWLLTVSVMPFPAALLAGYPLQPLPIAIYGADLILANVTGFLMIVYLKRHPELCVMPITSAALRSQAIVYVITNGMYGVAIGLAWVSPWVSYVMYALLLAWIMVRYAKISNPFETKHA